MAPGPGDDGMGTSSVVAAAPLDEVTLPPEARAAVATG